MTCKVVFDFHSLNDLKDFINSATQISDVPPTTPQPTLTSKASPVDDAIAEVKAKRGPKPKLPQVEEVEKIPEFLNKAQPRAVEEKKEPAITYDYVGKATTDAVKAAGRDKVVALLKDFGAATAKDLREEDWGAYMKACGKLIKPETEAELA